MKRWNGWGNVNTDYPVHLSALEYLTERLGHLDPARDSAKEILLSAVTESRLPAHPLVDSSAEARLTHSRGQSLPDWVELRAGRVTTFPDGVAVPTSEKDVRELLTYAHKIGARVIPYGGGTSVVGHINPLNSDAPVLTLSLEKMTRLLGLDETSRIANFEAGVAGPQLEAQLNRRGYTLGHFPQSFEYSTLGGWIATRSSGQQSLRYGRIEGMFAGGRMETPRGTLILPHFPASAAGIDLREMVLGSEGRLGVITQAKVRVRRVPEADEFHGVFFPSFEQGADAVREIVQDEIPVSMLRLSNPQETETTLILSGKSWVGAADRGLRMIGYGEARCLLIFAVTGSANLVRRARREVNATCRRFGGLFVGKIVGHTWEKNRFLSPYLRNTLWERGVAIDTLETALPWSQVLDASRAIPKSIVSAMASHNERVLAFAHLSHVYRDGASVYTTYLFRRASDPDELLARWRDMKRSASLTIQNLGGTITHQHGIGTDHAAHLESEKGALGMDALRAVCKTFDPDGMMNPGKLFHDG
ncbi:MAG: FAD-binding oxidoreductase [Anaerolineaceae bacterium]|nr:MAG: FAD-binding oxidoreductase [Anaerolineaceae bacterium]